MSAAFIGLDLAKSVLQVHGVDVHGKVVVTKRLRRDVVLAFFANLAPCVVWMEASVLHGEERGEEDPIPR
jgi:transposase